MSFSSFRPDQLGTKYKVLTCFSLHRTDFSSKHYELIPPHLRDDEDVVLVAFRKAKVRLSFASSRLRKQQNVWLECIRYNVQKFIVSHQHSSIGNTGVMITPVFPMELC